MPPPAPPNDSPFARPTLYGRQPQATLKIGALPKVAGPRPVRLAPAAAPRPTAPDRRGNILSGSLVPTGPGPAPRPEPPRPAPQAAAPEPAPLFVPPVRPQTKPARNRAPLIVGGTVVLLAAVIGALVVTGRDAGSSAVAPVAPVPAPTLAEAAPEPVVAAPPQAIAAPVERVALRPAITARRPAAAAPPAQAAPTPEPEPAPIVLNPAPVEAPPPTAPLELRPYTPPAEPDPEAPITLRGPQG